MALGSIVASRPEHSENEPEQSVLRSPGVAFGAIECSRKRTTKRCAWNGAMVSNLSPRLMLAPLSACARPGSCVLLTRRERAGLVERERHADALDGRAGLVDELGDQTA